MSQNALAGAMGVRSTQVLRWERGDYLPGILDLIRYAEACGTTADEFLGDLSRRPAARQLVLGLDLDPPARGVVLRLVHLLRARGHGAAQRRRRASAS